VHPQTGVCPVSLNGVYVLAANSLNSSIASGGDSTRHQWQRTAELIDGYIKPPLLSFSKEASEFAIVGD
jgi:hypothetical protein